jgi:hypothetical protein
VSEEGVGLLGCNAVETCTQTFRENASPPFSGHSCREDGGSMLLWNVCAICKFTRPYYTREVRRRDVIKPDTALSDVMLVPNASTQATVRSNVMSLFLLHRLSTHWGDVLRTRWQQPPSVRWHYEPPAADAVSDWACTNVHTGQQPVFLIPYGNIGLFIVYACERSILAPFKDLNWEGAFPPFIPDDGNIQFPKCCVCP